MEIVPVFLLFFTGELSEQRAITKPHTRHHRFFRYLTDVLPGLDRRTLLAIFAEFEREILRERTRAGLAQARQNGKRLGRPVTGLRRRGE